MAMGTDISAGLAGIEKALDGIVELGVQIEILPPPRRRLRPCREFVHHACIEQLQRRFIHALPPGFSDSHKLVRIDFCTRLATPR